MGVPQSKNNKQEENGTTKEPKAENKTAFNHGKAYDFTGSLNTTANTSQGLGCSQRISDQIEPNNGNEAMVTRVQEVPSVNALQNSAQSISIAVNILKDAADPVKCNPFLFSAVRVPHQHTSPAKCQNDKTSTSKLMLEPHDVTQNVSQQQQSGPSAQVKPKVRYITEQNTTKTGTAQGLANKPSEPSDHSKKKLDQSKALVNNDASVLPKRCMKLPKKPGDNHKSFQQRAEKTVTTVHKGSWQLGCNVMVEENTIKKQNEQHEIHQPYKDDNDTNGDSLSGSQKVNMKVPVATEMPTTAPQKLTKNKVTPVADTSVKLKHELTLPQHAAVEPKKKKNTRKVCMKEDMNRKTCRVEIDKQESGIIAEELPDHTVHIEGRWHPFTVNQSCSHKVCCKHNPRASLPPNIKKWSEDCPNYLCKPPLVKKESQPFQH